MWRLEFVQKCLLSRTLNQIRYNAKSCNQWSVQLWNPTSTWKLLFIGTEFYTGLLFYFGFGSRFSIQYRIWHTTLFELSSFTFRVIPFIRIFLVSFSVNNSVIVMFLWISCLCLLKLKTWLSDIFRTVRSLIFYMSIILDTEVKI